jgi:hypothetical protein
MKTNADPSALSSDISRLRRDLLQIHEQQLDLLRTMMGCGSMIAASVYQTYRTCSYPNCRCHKGQKHGPFLAISFSVDGKRRSRPVRHDDVVLVQKKAAAYRLFQKTLTRWRALHRHSEAILERIRELSVEQYP